MTAALEQEEAAAQAALQAELTAHEAGVWVDGEEPLASPGGGGAAAATVAASPMELSWGSEMGSLEDALALASAEVGDRSLLLPTHFMRAAPGPAAPAAPAAALQLDVG